MSTEDETQTGAPRTAGALIQEAARVVNWRPDDKHPMQARYDAARAMASMYAYWTVVSLETLRRTNPTLAEAQQVAEQIAARANQIAQGFQDTAVAHRELSDEHGRTLKGTSHMTTAHAFRNKADGAWEVARDAREIAHTATSCRKFVHGDDGRDWYCVCGHPADDHGMSPSKPGGPCTTCPVEAVKS